jgi:hypothetical protein
MVDDSLLRVIHFTLGPLKPWDWWTAFILNPVDKWEEFRQRLPASTPGTGAGWTHHTSRSVTLLAVLPFLVSALLARKWLLQVGGFWSF